MSRSPETKETEGRVINIHVLSERDILNIQQANLAGLKDRTHQIVADIAQLDELASLGNKFAEAKRQRPRLVELTPEEYRLLAATLGWDMDESDSNPDSDQPSPDGYVEDIQRFPDDV